MKYCPSPTCPYAAKFGRAAEFVDGVEACTECGSALGASPPRPAAVAPPRPDGDALVRLGISALAIVLVVAGLRAPLLGAEQSVFGSQLHAARTPAFSLLAFGVGPFITGSLLVEFLALAVPNLARRRLGSGRERAPVDALALAVGAALLALQILAVTRFAEGNPDVVGVLPTTGLLWAQYLLAHGALLGLVLAVTRRGLGNGFSIAVLAALVNEVLRGAAVVGEAFAEDTLTLGTVLLPVGALASISALTVRFSRATRLRGGPGPVGAPFPVSSLAPWSIAATLVALPLSVGAFLPFAQELGAALQSSVWLYNGVASFLAIDGVLVCALVFFRPRSVGRIWARWVDGIDEPGVVLRARALLPRAVLLSAGVVLAPPLVMALLQISVGPVLMVSALEWVGATLVVLDLVEEWTARRRLGRLVSVRPIHRMPEVEAIAFVLARASIPHHMRSSAYRAALQFFGPYVPVEVLVPEARAAEARKLLDGA